MNSRANKLAPFVLASALVAGGCCASVPPAAIVGGVEIPRPTLRFTGQPYSLEHFHAHPQPGGPSEGLVADGGWIGGEVCRNNVLYFVEHHGEHVLLEGYVGGRGGDWVVVRDGERGRSISGRFGTIWLTADSISGTYLDHPLRLVRSGDRLVGQLGENRVVFKGVEGLWNMPAADQAVLIDQLFACRPDAMPARLRLASFGSQNPIEVRFGGEPTNFPIDD